MVIATAEFASWVEQADIPQSRLSPEVQAVLAAAFRFRQRQGQDYYSTRLLSHFLLHCDCGLKVAQVARLLGISRPHASAQQGTSSKEVIRLAHHRQRGRPHGKLLPRFAGAIAGFLLRHPDSTRADLLDFIEATFDVRVSRVALYKFLKKFGLDHLPGPAQPEAPAGTTHGTAAPGTPEGPAPAPASPDARAAPPHARAAPGAPGAPAPAPASAAPPGLPFPPPAAAPAPADLPGRVLLPGPPGAAPPFSSAARSTPAPSC